MRKTLVALAVSAAMWAGSAQAAYVINLKGTVAFSFANGPDAASAAALYGTSPLAFDLRLSFDDGLDSPNTPLYFGNVEALSLNGNVVNLSSQAVTAIGWPNTTSIGFEGRDTNDTRMSLTLFSQLTPNGSSAPRLPASVGDLTGALQFGFSFYPNFVNSTSYSQAAYFGATTFTEFSASGTLPELRPDYGVPEPATWAMMLAGFGLVGGSLRRRPASISCRV